MTIKDLYEKIGGKYEDVLGRLMKDSLIEKFVVMYAKDSTYDNLIAAINAGDISEQFRAAHSLKGISANLGFEELRKAASELTEQLRFKDKPADPALVEAVKYSQEKIMAGIAEYQAQA